MNFRQLTGYDALLESVSTFAATMFFIVAFGSFFINPTGELPYAYKAAIEAPFSFILPFYLGCFGFSVSFLCTQLGSGPIPRCPVLKWLIRAPTRAGVAGLGISSGGLLGFSLALLLWAGPYNVLQHAAEEGIVLSGVLGLILGSIFIAHAFNFLHLDIKPRQLLISVAGYCVLSASLFFLSLLMNGNRLLGAVLVPAGISVGFCLWLLLILDDLRAQKAVR